jgi:hypothetical protein
VSVRIARRGAIAASRGAAGTPTTYTIFGDTSDGRTFSEHSSYATARTAIGTGGSTATGNDHPVGQNFFSPNYYCFQMLIAFDTSAIPDTATITAVTLSMYSEQNNSTTDFTVEARLFDWGATVTNADYVSGDDMAAKTLLASYPTSSHVINAYNVLTSEAAFAANINLTGFTRILLCSSRQRVGNTPTGNEYVNLNTAENTGITKDPKLVVEALV